MARAASLRAAYDWSRRASHAAAVKGTPPKSTPCAMLWVAHTTGGWGRTAWPNMRCMSDTAHHPGPENTMAIYDGQGVARGR